MTRHSCVLSEHSTQQKVFSLQKECPSPASLSFQCTVAANQSTWSDDKASATSSSLSACQPLSIPRLAGAFRKSITATPWAWFSSSRPKVRAASLEQCEQIYDPRSLTSTRTAKSRMAFSNCCRNSTSVVVVNTNLRSCVVGSLAWLATDESPWNGLMKMVLLSAKLQQPLHASLARASTTNVPIRTVWTDLAGTATC